MDVDSASAVALASVVLLVAGAPAVEVGLVVAPEVSVLGPLVATEGPQTTTSMMGSNDVHVPFSNPRAMPRAYLLGSSLSTSTETAEAPRSGEAELDLVRRTVPGSCPQAFRWSGLGSSGTDEFRRRHHSTARSP